MNALSLENINKRSPYLICAASEAGYYEFSTDYGVEYVLGFMPDDLLHSDESYQFLISNTNHKTSPLDKNVQLTVQVVIEEFFRANNTTMLYICETGDGKQAMRSRLFERWFMGYSENANFTFLHTSITTIEGETNYASLLVRNDNPRLTDVILEFTETIRLLSSKPDEKR